MEKNLALDNIVASTSLEGKEGYAVDFEGNLITTSGTGCLGVVYEGRGAGEASVAAISGTIDAYVDGSSVAIAVNDPLTAGNGATAGEFTKATIGTDPIRAYAREAATSETKISITLI